MKSTKIGEVVMAHLIEDRLFRFRLCPLHRQFADVNSFMQEIQNMLDAEREIKKKGGCCTFVQHH